MKICDQDKQLTPFLLGELSEAEAAAVEQHLEQCPECQASRQELAPTLQALQQGLARDAAAPLALTDAQRRALLAIRPQARRPLLFWLRVYAPALAAAASLVVVLGGIWATMQRGAVMPYRVPKGTGEPVVNVAKMVKIKKTREPLAAMELAPQKMELAESGSPAPEMRDRYERSASDVLSQTLSDGTYVRRRFTKPDPAAEQELGRDRGDFDGDGLAGRIVPVDPPAKTAYRGFEIATGEEVKRQHLPVISAVSDALSDGWSKDANALLTGTDAEDALTRAPEKRGQIAAGAAIPPPPPAPVLNRIVDYNAAVPAKEDVALKKQKNNRKQETPPKESATFAFYCPDLSDTKMEAQGEGDKLATYVADPVRIMSTLGTPRAGNMGKGGKGKGGWPDGMDNHLIRFIRMEYDGHGWDDGMDATSRAELNFLDTFHQVTGFKVTNKTESHPIRLLRKYPKGYAPPFVYMTGDDTIQVSAADAKILRDYLAGGGMLLADCGSPQWGKNFQDFVNKQLFPGQALVAIADDDPLFQVPYAFANGAPPLWHHAGTRVMGLKNNNRWSVYFHPGDLKDAWKTGHSGMDPKLAEDATRIGINVVYYAFTQYLEYTKGQRGAPPATPPVVAPPAPPAPPAPATPAAPRHPPSRWLRCHLCHHRRRPSPPRPRVRPLPATPLSRWPRSHFRPLPSMWIPPRTP